jgi:hypothetical protein
MIRTPVNNGLSQTDLDFANFKALRANLADYAGTGLTWNSTTGKFDASGGGGVTGGHRINPKDPPYNAAGDGVTDDTAVIQDIIDDLALAGGGTIAFPDEGPYLIAGPLLDPTRRNAQILLPAVDCRDSRQFAIVFEGYAPVDVCTASVYQIPMPHGSRLKSTLAAGSGTQPSVICGWGPPGSPYPNPPWEETSYIHVEFRNMILETVPNPSYSFLNLKRVMSVTLQDTLVIAGQYFDTMRMTEPTVTTSYGMILPDNVRGEAVFMRGNINVFGFYNGIGWPELCVADMVSCLACKVGLVIPESNHPSIVQRYLSWFCTRGAVVTGQHRLHVLQWDTERGPTGVWYRTQYELDDPSNLLVGSTEHFTYDNSIPDSVPYMNVNGGANFMRRQIGGASTYNPNIVPIGTDARLVPISGGAKLEARNTSTGVWVEAARWTNP